MEETVYDNYATMIDRLKRELFEWQQEIAESENSFSESSKFEVGLVESVAPVLRHLSFVAVEEDGGTAVKDALWSSLHHQDVLLVVSQLVD